MALKSRSSAVKSVSPLGEILPTKISSGPTSAPILIIPSSSKSFKRFSPTLGISAVVVSGPNLVSRTSQVNSSIWIEEKRSSFTNLSEIIIASSKLAPAQGIKATKTF
ncbi:hypothetical protein ES703_118355 [subsurface metagenome]